MFLYSKWNSKFFGKVIIIKINIKININNKYKNKINNKENQKKIGILNTNETFKELIKVLNERLHGGI